MNFSDWREALPFALRIGKAYARRGPLRLDVESAVMEALWRAQRNGNDLTPGYVAMRVKGALIDEIRRVSEGQRRNPQSVSSFVDIDDQRDLSAPSHDLDELLDQRRKFESMPSAARQLITRLAHGEQQQDIARSLGVSAPRIGQVTHALRTNPNSLTRLPGHVDLFEEIRRAHRRMVTRAYAETGTVTGVAHALGVSVSDASRWVNQRKLILPSKYRQFPELREKARKLIQAAFVRAKGSPMTAARLLTTECSVAGALGREFSPEVVRSNRRPDITTESVARLCREGWSQERIASHFGVSEHAISNRVRRARLPTLLRTRPDLPDGAFAALRARGLKHREIAASLGVSMATVCVRLRRIKPLRKCQP